MKEKSEKALRKKVFCEECRKDTGYDVEARAMEGTVKGESFRFDGRRACCAECGGEVYVPEIHDANLTSLYDRYREKHGIISLEKLRRLPGKYAIGGRSLSLLLGWEEQAFFRCLEGDMPLKGYSELLLKIDREPRYYERLLEKNRGKLKTEVYEKSKAAVKKLLFASGKQNAGTAETSKIDLAIGYLLDRCEDVTPLALQKALYYTQGFFYAFYRTFLFEEDCEAWVHGPVYREVYFRYRDYRFDAIGDAGGTEPALFTAQERAVLDSVVKNICCYSGKVLESFTHAEAPWNRAREGLAADAGSDRVIEKEYIGEYFTGIREKYHMISPADIGKYTRRMFERM